MGLLDWLTDLQGGGGGPSPGTMGMVDPMGNATGGSMPPPTPAPAPTRAMPPVQMTGQDAPYPPGGDPMTAGGPPPFNSDPMTAGGTPPNGPGLPFPPGTDPMTAGGPTPNGPGIPPPPPQNVPVPTPRPTGAGVPTPPPSPMPGAGPGMPPGAPMQIAPQAPGGGNQPPSQTWLGRALGITPDQAGLQGRQVGAGVAAGLKSVGDNWNKPGLAAFAGSAGAAMEGGSKEQQVQQKQVTDYLNAAIKAKQQGDEAGYKQKYLRYLAAKLKVDTDKAASKDAAANKNDTPTQLYLASQRLVQPDRNAMNKQLEQMRKDGADPAEIAKKQAELETAINAKLTGHYATLGIHPQDAATLAKQPGNAQENPIDAGKMGITKDNIGQKLQPGQYYKNPSDGKVYEFKGPPKKEAVKGVPDKPTAPEPVDPMHPYKTPLDAGGSSNDDED